MRYEYSKLIDEIEFMIEDMTEASQHQQGDEQEQTKLLIERFQQVRMNKTWLANFFFIIIVSFWFAF